MTRKRVNPMRLTPACSSSMLRRMRMMMGRRVGMRMGMRRRREIFFDFLPILRKYLQRDKV